MEKMMTVLCHAVPFPGYLYDNLDKQSARGREGQKVNALLAGCHSLCGD